jgi:Tfp pilus assembly protein PilV
MIVSTSTRRTRSDAGLSLIETMFALSLLMIASLGLIPLGIIATTTTENQGHLMARTTEYSQDKLEQLLALSYGDVVSDTRAPTTLAAGGSGLAVGGSSNAAAPVALYVDYLDAEGTMIPSVGTAAPDGWYYKRVWLVEQAAANLKRITVTTTVVGAVGSVGRIPTATVASLKTFPF